MSDGMGRELAYLSSHATNRYFIPNWGIYINNLDHLLNGDGTFTSKPLDFGDYTLGGFISGSFADYDRDGRIDALASLTNNKNNKNCYAVAFNKGNGKFDVVEIKLPANSELSSDSKPYDIDGYMDICQSEERGGCHLMEWRNRQGEHE